MKYSICGDMLLKNLSDKERLRYAVNAGFEYYEFWTWKNKDVSLYKEACNELGLKISAFSGDDAFSLVEPEEEGPYLDYFKKSIECAIFLGVDTLIVHSDALLFEEGIMPAKQCNSVLTTEDKFKNSIERLKKMSLFAEKGGINISLEILNTKYDHPGYYINSIKTAIDICKAIGNERLKVLYDVYHMQLMEGNIINSINEYFNYIGYVHIADVPGRYEPGTGELNYENILKNLKNMKYNGFVGFECLPLNCLEEAISSIKLLTSKL